MGIDRRRLYRFPWSITDNPGGWVDVTDVCGLNCAHCFRRRVEGHRPLAAVLSDIDACRSLRNCDDMKISGGEPLTYPHLLDVVRHIARKGMKPFLMTSGLGLDLALVKELARAGLVRFNLHIDSTQDRPGWEGRTEVELNELRQFYADLIASVKGVGCGFNVTVSPSNLAAVPDVVGWAVRNIRAVQHITFIALRGLVVGDDVAILAKGRRLPPQLVPNRVDDPSKVALTAETIAETIAARFPEIRPSGYLNGGAFPETNKYLVSVAIGSSAGAHGSFGARALEIVQVVTHVVKGRYEAITRSAKVGRKVFLLGMLDSEVRRAGRRYLGAMACYPIRIFAPVYLLVLAIEQPLELIEGETNICDDCINMMVFRGRLIPSCRIEEYRAFGGPLISQKTD